MLVGQFCLSYLGSLIWVGWNGFTWSNWDGLASSHTVFNTKLLHNLMFSRQHFKRQHRHCKAPSGLGFQTQIASLQPHPVCQSELKISLDARVWGKRLPFCMGEAEKPHYKGECRLGCGKRQPLNSILHHHYVDSATFFLSP